MVRLDGCGVDSASRVFDGVNNVSQVFDAFIGERLGDRPVVVGEGIVDNSYAAILGEHPDRRLQHHVLGRSEEHTSELQSLMRRSYAVFCLKKKKKKHTNL